MYLSSKNIGDENYLAGETINVNVSERTLPQIKVIRPDNREDFINMDENLRTDFVSYGSTFTAGNYKFFSGEKLLISSKCKY